MADHVKIGADAGSIGLGGGGEWSFRVAGPARVSLSIWTSCGPCLLKAHHVHAHCVSMYAKCVCVCVCVCVWRGGEDVSDPRNEIASNYDQCNLRSGNETSV